MGNLVLRRKKDLSTFRRLALGTWRTAYDPSVYGTLNVPADKMLAYIEAFRGRTGRRVTISHAMAKVVAAALEKMPDANAILRWKWIYLREDIGVFFQVAMEDEKTGEIDLSGATIHRANEKSLYQIVDEFEQKVSKVRQYEDPELEKSRSMMRRVPLFLIHLVLRLISFLSYTLNLNLKWAGVPKDPFGSVMVTNIGSLGLDQGWVPIVPYSRVPLLIAVGAVREVPVVRDGAVVTEKQISLNATFDHRVLDGSHAAVMSRVIKEWFDDPAAHLDAIDDLPQAG